MPIGRYFLFTGSLLFALLILADWYFPASSAEPARLDADRSAIRIHSAHKWPKAVVFDTTLPATMPTITAVAAVETPTAKPAREAFAMASEQPSAIKPVQAVKPTKPRMRHTRTAGATARHVASYDAFAFRPMWAPSW